MAHTIYSKAGADSAIAAAVAAIPAGGGAVDSVNGQTGAVVLDASDVGADAAGTAAGLVAALDIPAAAYPVQQVTLTADLAYTLPAGAPTDQVIGVVFTQDGTGGHTVTYGGQPVAVDTTAGAQTQVEFRPNGTAARTVVHPLAPTTVGLSRALLGLPADVDARPLVAPSHEEPMTLTADRRNIWQYSEQIGGSEYQTNGVVKRAETITAANGVILTRTDWDGFYNSLYSNILGLGLNPFVVGNYYVLSFYAYLQAESDRFVWSRYLGDQQHGHTRHFLPAQMTTRVWTIKKATATNQLATLVDPAAGWGSASGSQTWVARGSQPEGEEFSLYLGGFQIESVGATDPRAGIIGIGDSTMQGSSGTSDLTTSRDWMGYLSGLLNVPTFNRGVAGERLDQMAARWATAVTPLAPLSSYVVIQGGINDLVQGAGLATLQSRVATLVASAVADGLVPVLVTCTPTKEIAALPAQEAVRIQFNAWLRSAYPNAIDIATVVADPAEPSSLRRDSGWYGEGTHFGPLAHRAVGAAVAGWTGWRRIVPTAYQKVVGTTADTAGPLPELIRDTMSAALVAGANVTITPDDAGDTITIAAAASGGSGSLDMGSMFMPCPVGKYLPYFAAGVANSSLNIANSTANSVLYMRVCPVFAKGAYTYDLVSFGLATPATDAGSLIRIALYTADGAFVKELGTVDATSAAGTKSIVISESLAAGVHLLAMRFQSPTTAGTNPLFYGYTGAVGEITNSTPGDPAVQYKCLSHSATPLTSWPTQHPNNYNSPLPATAASPQISLRRQA